MGEEEILKALSSRTNQGILSLLTVEPTYPRKIGDLLSLSETEVARRLKHMEGLGLVTSAWTYIGKNVKLYKLATNRVSLQFAADGLKIELGGLRDGAATSITVNPLVEHVPTTAEFVGRAAELDSLGGAERVYLVVGLPGIGKTALLSRFAASQQGNRSVFWHSFRGVESLNWLANRLAVFVAQAGNRALLEAVERGAEVADKRELMLQSMDDERFLLVFDDAHRIEDDAVRSFLTDAVTRVRRGKLILAGREPLRYDPSLKHVRLLRLGGLTDEDVRDFLDLKGLELDAALLPKLRAEVGGHPLALNLLLEAAKERNVPVVELLDRIPEKNLEDYLLQEVYQGLSDDEKKVLALASLFRNRFTLDDLDALATKNLEAPLLHLRRRLFVESYEGEYGLHEILRNFFYKLLQDKERLHQKAAERFVGRGTIEGRLEALHHFLAAGRRDRVLALLEEDLDLQDFNVVDAGYQNLYLGILELFQKNEVADARRWALIEDEKGDIRFHRAEYERALTHHEAAAAHFEKAKDPARVADLAWKRAMALQRLGRAKEAAALCEAGLKEAPKDGVQRTRLEGLRVQLREAKPQRKTATA